MGRPKTGKLLARGDNTWRLYWELGDDAETGKRRQKTETFHGTKEEARKYWRKRQAEIDAGKHHPRPKGVTVADLTARWMSDFLPTQNLRASTVAHYRDYADRYVVPTLGSMVLTRLTPPDVQRALAGWLAQPRRQGSTGPLSPTTVHKIYRLLRAILDQGVEWELLDANPVRKVKPPTMGDYHPQIWDAQAIRAFMGAASQHRWGVGFRLGLFGGLRRGEILGLRWGDVDWDTGTLILRHTLVNVPGQGDIPETPKTKAGWRTVVIDAESLNWLHRRRAYAAADARAAGEVYRDHGYVLQTSVGTPVMTRNFNRTFDELCDKVGVPRIRLHDLRHTHGTVLHEAGVDMKTIQVRLGHSSIGVTSKFYVHPGLAPQQDAMARFDDWLNGPKNGPK